jgi:hypothetical protein
VIEATWWDWKASDAEGIQGRACSPRKVPCRHTVDPSVPTKERLEFRVRHGLGRFFGPWRLERNDVRLVYRTMRGLDTFHGLGFVRPDGTWWTFWTYHPDEVLDFLEELGYPIDPKTRHGQGRFVSR